VTAEIERVNVIALAQRPRNPIPVSRMIQPSVHKYQRGLVIVAIIPELQLEAIGIEKV
jgi:hypothetical protein